MDALRLPITFDQALLVAQSGVPYAVAPDADGIEVWLDLMASLEVICPEMPRPDAQIWKECRL